MNRVPEDRVHRYVWLVTCPECKKTYCEQGKSKHYIPIPVLLRRRRYAGSCGKCRAKADIQKFKDFFKNKGGDSVQGNQEYSI